MALYSGVDIVKISRIDNLIINKREKFLQKVFTRTEIDYIKSRGYNPQTVSGIFAAKEAISKMLGIGIGKMGWKDAEIIHNNGKPNIRLYNYGLNVSRELGIESITLSISHEKEYAIAFAVGGSVNYKKSIHVPSIIKDILPKRGDDTYKGSYGKVGIIAGSRGMVGASFLTTMAALRSGCGLAYTIVPDSLGNVFSIKLTESIIKPVKDDNTGHFTFNSLDEVQDIIKNMDVLAMGPGMGVCQSRAQLINAILLNFKKPIVLDADGINCISGFNQEVLFNRKWPTIITPHPGELAKLLKIDINVLQENRSHYSIYASCQYNLITVLKGFNTIIANSNGDTFTNPTGNPGMATAGSGDVLTGIIASFIGQGIPPYKASILGVYCHGLAGDLARDNKGEYGMISTDILDNIPDAIKLLTDN